MSGGAPWTLLGVPIDSVGRAGGTELAPAALRAAGLASRVPDDAGDVAARIHGHRRDPSGVIDLAGVLAVTAEVRERVGTVLAAGRRPLVLGGCCTLVPGVCAALRDRWPDGTGLVYVDGHFDLYDGRTSPTGEAADMPVSVALGRGPAAWSAAAATAGAPPLQEGELALVGFRDPDEARDVAWPAAWIDTDIAFFPRRDLPTATLGATLAERFAAAPGRFWVHLDVDALSEDVFPATDYLMPGGLGWVELRQLLAPLLRHPACVGANVTCVNPEKDPGGASVRRLVTLLVDALD